MDSEEEDYNNYRSLIVDFPPEVLLRIFAYIDIKTLFQVVILTCRRFHELLTIDGIWKTLFALKWKEHCIVDDLNYIHDWRNVCSSYEAVDRYWKLKKNENIKLISQRFIGHYGSVDSVYIPASESFCVSGSRDRSIMVWNFEQFTDREADVPCCLLHGHKGWVWTIDSFDNKNNEIVSGSWDKTIKVWDLQQEVCIDTHHYHQAAVLDLCCHDNVYTTGCFDKTVRTFDPRSKSVVINSMHHKKPVLSIEVTEKYILSGSEDKTIGVYDVRGRKLLTTLRVDSPVLCMNLGYDQGFRYLRAGGNNGSFYIFDLTEDRFTLLDSSQLWKQHKVNSLCNFKGCLVAGSKSGSVCMFTPGRKIEPIAKFDTFTADISSLHARNTLLAAGRCDNSVTVWRFLEESVEVS